MAMTDSIFVKTILGGFEMRDEFEVIFNTTPHVLSEELMYNMDFGIIWENTTQESWRDYVAMWCSLSV